MSASAADTFAETIAPARTFGFLREVETLRQQRPRPRGQPRERGGDRRDGRPQPEAALRGRVRPPQDPRRDRGPVAPRPPAWSATSRRARPATRCTPRWPAQLLETPDAWTLVALPQLPVVDAPVAGARARVPSRLARRAQPFDGARLQRASRRARDHGLDLQLQGGLRGIVRLDEHALLQLPVWSGARLKRDAQGRARARLQRLAVAPRPRCSRRSWTTLSITRSASPMLRSRTPSAASSPGPHVAEVERRRLHRDAGPPPQATARRRPRRETRARTASGERRRAPAAVSVTPTPPPARPRPFFFPVGELAHVGVEHLVLVGDGVQEQALHQVAPALLLGHLLHERPGSPASCPRRRPAARA